MSRPATAVVVGASMGGLLAVRALSGHFERITVVERDVLPDSEEARKGVPQSAHAHGLLASGYGIIDAYFPDIMAELEARGAPRGDVVGDFLWFQYGHWKLRHDSGLRGITVSRPCLESAVRQRVKALRNVTFLEGADAVRPTFDAATRRVNGLVVRPRDRNVEQTLEADLVVDASAEGRNPRSGSSRWAAVGPRKSRSRSTSGMRLEPSHESRASSLARWAASSRARRRRAPGTGRSLPPNAIGGSSRSWAPSATIRRRTKRRGSRSPQACPCPRSTSS